MDELEKQSDREYHQQLLETLAAQDAAEEAAEARRAETRRQVARDRKAQLDEHIQQRLQELNVCSFISVSSTLV